MWEKGPGDRLVQKEREAGHLIQKTMVIMLKLNIITFIQLNICICLGLSLELEKGYILNREIL